MNGLWSLKASPATKAQNPLSMEGKSKRSSCDYRHHPVDAFMAIVAYFDMLMVRGNPARGREKKVSRNSCYHEKKQVQGCVSQNSDPMSSIPLKVEEMGLNASAGHTRKFSGCTRYEIEFGKEKGNLEALSQKVNLVSEILARPVLTNNHLRKPHDKQIVPAK